MSWSDGWGGRDDDTAAGSGSGSTASTSASTSGARPNPSRSFHLRRRGGGRVRDWLTRPAMLGVLLLTMSYLSILAHVTDVVGGTEFLVLEVVAVLVAATLVAALLDLRAAMVVSVGLLAGGLGIYYLSIPESQRALVSFGSTVNDLGALMTGLSVLRLVNAQIWVYAVVPAPLFASWILALRGRYALSVLVGGTVLGFFILTGNADTTTTLLGVVGATIAVGLGELDPRGALDAQWDTVVLVVVAMVVVSASISLVPGGSAEPIFFGDGTPTLEANLVDNSESVGILGSIRLSPKVRFTIESDRSSYWRVGGYDRFTGDSWVRTGESQPYRGELQGPPGESRRVVQNVTAVTPLNALPAAWKPVSVDPDIADDTEVTVQGGLRASDAVGAEETYTVVSEMPRHTTETLRDAGDDYPGAVESRYLQLPGSTPDRVGERTQQVVDEANATTAYDRAVAIERYLESTKRYSLNVQRPDGNIADEFLFEMDAGYCTYYATTMVVMLRTQGIPARFVTGYTTGERVAQDEWVVRGTNAHAWVEIYFPDVGWVAFDPTPSGPRQAVEDQRLAEARESDEEGVDTGDSGPEEWTPTPTESPSVTESTENSTGGDPGSIPGADNRTPPDGPFAGGGDFGTAGTVNATSPGVGSGFEMPTRKELGYGFAILLGFLAAGRRFGADRRLYRFLWLRYQPRSDPVSDVERAYERLEALLEERHRPRRRGETPNDYLDNLVGVDPRARQVVRLYELAHYRRSVTDAQADRAVRLVDGMVGETTPVVGRLRRAVGRSA
jgi:transglutaminase-like putative cysteine protease